VPVGILGLGLVGLGLALLLRWLPATLGVGPRGGIRHVAVGLHLGADGADGFVVDLRRLGDLPIGLLGLRLDQLGD